MSVTNDVKLGVEKPLDAYRCRSGCISGTFNRASRPSHQTSQVTTAARSTIDCSHNPRVCVASSVSSSLHRNPFVLFPSAKMRSSKKALTAAASAPDQPLFDFIRSVVPVPDGPLVVKQQRFRELIVITSALEFGMPLTNTIHLMHRVTLNGLQEDIASVGPPSHPLCRILSLVRVNALCWVLALVM